MVKRKKKGSLKIQRKLGYLYFFKEKDWGEERENLMYVPWCPMECAREIENLKRLDIQVYCFEVHVGPALSFYSQEEVWCTKIQQTGKVVPTEPNKFHLHRRQLYRTFQSKWVGGWVTDKNG
jgi:hypothetical protein